MAGTSTRRQLLMPASRSERASDADRLARLMRVELLLLYVYENVLATGLLGPEEHAALAPIPGYEQQHIAALRERLVARGGTVPVGPPSIEVANHHLAHRKIGGRLGQLRNRKDAMFLLFATERVVIGAYYVALLKLFDAGLITLAAQIMASDAQHEAILGELLNPGEIGYAVPYSLIQGQQ